MNNQDIVHTITRNLMVKIISEKDKLLKEELIKYAQYKSKELGHEIEMLFLHSEIADEIIELGLQALRDKHKRSY